MQQLQVRLADQRVEGRGSDPQIFFFRGERCDFGVPLVSLNSNQLVWIRKSCPIVCWFDTVF